MFLYIKIRCACIRCFLLDIFWHLVQMYRSVLDVFVLDVFKSSVLDVQTSKTDV